MRRAGPKAAVESEPLDLPNSRVRSRQFKTFCTRYVPVRTKKGPKPLKLRPWQLELVASVFDAKPEPRLAGWMMGRGNGKSTLVAAVALWDLFAGQYGANIVCCAVDERQAGILFDIAVWMVENSPELASRAHIFRDRIVVPGRAATLRVLPAEAKRLEGLDFSLGILDESGFASIDTFETLNDSQGKRETSVLLLIGTPGTDPESPLIRVRTQALADPSDKLTVWREFSADEFKSHPYDCEHCIALANPAYGDFLHASGVRGAMPPKSSEARFRRVRLCQFVLGNGDSYLPSDAYDACQDANRIITPKSPVVLALDGSRTNDSTAITMVSIEKRPILQLEGLWEPHLQDADYRVPILDVEEKLRQLCKTYDVKEIVCDPFGWERTIQALTDEGLPMVEHPNTRERMAGPIAAFREAVHQKEITHNGDAKLRQHVLNAVIREHARGISVEKTSPKSSFKIDALVSGIMAYGRAKWHLANKPKSKRLYVF